MAELKSPQQRLDFIKKGVREVKGGQFHTLKPISQQLFNDIEWLSNELQTAWSAQDKAKGMHLRLKNMVDNTKDLDPEIVKMVDEEFENLI